jgi:hypothetical protein
LVTLHGQNYGAVVVHSSTHDKRRHKRIDRMLVQKRKERESTCKQIMRGPFSATPMPKKQPISYARQPRGAITSCSGISKKGTSTPEADMQPASSASPLVMSISLK